MSPDAIRPLLDPASVAALATRIPALGGRAAMPVEVVAFWVKPGRHFNACYAVALQRPGAPPALVSAFALEEEQADALMAKLGPHRCRAAPSPGCPPCATARVDAHLVLQLFPFDHRLPSLPACLEPAAVQAALGTGAEITLCEPSGYRPGMRCQVRYVFADGSALYGKVAVEREPGRAFAVLRRVHAALDPDVRFTTPRPVCHAPDLQLTVVSAAPGRSLYEAPPSGADLDRVGAALADLHGLDLAGIDRAYTPADELALLRGWTALAGALLPPHAAALQAAADGLAAAMPPEVAPRALVHRDFYDKQVLLTPDRLTFLDLDTLCRGDAEIDLGNFCAHIRLRAAQAGDAARASGAEARFLAAYPVAADPARVAWYRRTTLLRLACLYGLRPRWRHLVAPLVTEASVHP